MRVLLIMPDANMHKFMLFGRLRSAREAPLTLTTLAAIGNQGCADIEFTAIDESVDRIPLNYNGDLVCISVLTGTARRAYAISDHFRSKGIPVVLGGIHVTLMPEEAAKFADSIVIGMAEQTFPEVLNDFNNGNLKSVYKATPEEGNFVTGIPEPLYDIQRHNGYMMPYVVQATRGCVHSCDFCSVPAAYGGFWRRPVGELVDIIKRIPKKRFVINDVSPFDDIEYAKELLKALIPLRKKWGGLATTRIADDPELFDLLIESGCQYLLIGFESINQKVLGSIYKGFNKKDDYSELMRKLRSAKIMVQGCFVFGFDEDDTTVFSNTVDTVQQLHIDIPRYSIYTPYPGTRLFHRLDEEQRILSKDWGDYDTMHVVFRPKLMTPVELYEGFRWAYKETFKWGNIFDRVKGSGTRFPIAFVGNLTYRTFVGRVWKQKGFEYPLV